MVRALVANFIPVGACGAELPMVFAVPELESPVPELEFPVPEPEEETLVTLNFGAEKEMSLMVTSRPSVPLSAAVHLLHVTVSVPASAVDFDSAVRATLSSFVMSVSVAAILN